MKLHSVHRLPDLPNERLIQDVFARQVVGQKALIALDRIMNYAESSVEDELSILLRYAELYRGDMMFFEDEKNDSQSVAMDAIERLRVVDRFSIEEDPTFVQRRNQIVDVMIATLMRV